MAKKLFGIAALKKAKEALGTEAAVAAVVGVSQPTVHYTLNKAKRVPAEWCIPLDLATARKNARISCHQLRPDLWSEDFTPSAKAA